MNYDRNSALNFSETVGVAKKTDAGTVRETRCSRYTNTVAAFRSPYSPMINNTRGKRGETAVKYTRTIMRYDSWGIRLQSRMYS